MSSQDSLEQVYDELEAGMALAKCRQCGCMQDTLDVLTPAVKELPEREHQRLAGRIEQWHEQMKAVRYACLGCAHCYPAVAQNIFSAAYPTIALAALSCNFEVKSTIWPPVVGEYFVLDRTGPVAISTLASLSLAEALADHDLSGLALVGKTETENIGIDKIVKNVITNPAIRFLIVAGKDSQGHQSGRTLLALGRNGIDDKGRIMGAPGKQAVLKNVTQDEVLSFRRQVEIIDMIGCQDIELIRAKVHELANDLTACACGSCGPQIPVIDRSDAIAVTAKPPDKPVKLDRAGYFVILPVVDRRTISVEHYNYAHELLHTLQGESAKMIYRTIIDQGWLSELSHAAYLGKELERAELSMRYGFKYVQDGA